MKTVDQDILDNIEGVNTVTAQLTLQREGFEYTRVEISDSLGLSDPSSVDISTYSTGFLRVVNYQGTLYTQTIATIGSLWPNWVSASISLKSGSRPGVEGSSIWYQDTTGDIHRKIVGGSDTVISTGFRLFTVTLAPTSSGCYIHYLEYGWGCLAYVSNAGSVTLWDGRIYGDIQTSLFLDAVTLGSKDYVYVMDRNAGRVLELVRIGGNWSTPTMVIPMDIVDNVTGLYLGGASVIGGYVFLTGQLSSGDDVGKITYDVVLRGPDVFARSKNCFICEPNLNGKMLLVGTKVYYVGVGEYYWKEAGSFFGVDNVNLKEVTADLSSLEMSQSQDGATGIMCTVAHDVDVLPNDDVTINIIYTLLDENEEEYTRTVKLTKATIVDVTNIYENGQQVQINGIAQGFNKLDFWSPDQSIYRPSQARVSAHPGDLAQVVRARGIFPNGTLAPLIYPELNEYGMLYSVARSSSNYLSRAKFRYPSTEITSRFGVFTNFYQENREEAAQRLEKEWDQVTELEYGNNCILALYGPTEHSGASGVALYLMTNGVMTKLTSASTTIPADTWMWLQMTFIDGVIRVMKRSAADTTWAVVLETTYTSDARMPWKREVYGRAGLYIENITPWSTQYGLSSDGMIIGVEDNTVFEVSTGVVRIDDEQIQWTGKSGHITPVGPLSGTGTEDNYTNTEGFDGYQVIIANIDGVMPDHSYIGNALVVTDGAGKGTTFEITDYDATAPDYWVPTGEYELPDRWQDHIGDGNYGSWQPSNCRRIFVQEDPSGILGADSKVKITDSLQVTTRGYNSSLATTHSEGKCSIYSALSVECDKLDAYSGDMDMSIEDQMIEISLRAGTDRPSCNAYIDGAVQTNWSVAQLVDKRNFLGTISVIPGKASGFVFRTSGTAGDARAFGPALADGYMVIIENGYVTLYSANQTSWSVLEDVPLEYPEEGEFRLSVVDDSFSVWINGRFVHTFQDGGLTEGKFGFAGEAATWDVHVSELCEVPPDIGIDTTSSGMNVVQNIIGGRHIKFTFDENGAMRLYRSRVNYGNYPDLVVSAQRKRNADIFTHVRADGIKRASYFDPAATKLYGRRFITIDAQYANTVDEVLREARLAVAEALKNREQWSIQTVPHPGVEPGDSFTFTLPTGSVVLDVLGTTMSLAINEGELSYAGMLECALHE